MTESRTDWLLGNGHLPAPSELNLLFMQEFNGFTRHRYTLCEAVSLSEDRPSGLPGPRLGLPPRALTVS